MGLRAIGEWSESGYVVGVGLGQEPVAMKQFMWSGEAVAEANGARMKLRYFSNVTVEPRRMNDLTYLAEAEREAMGVLEAMVGDGTVGWGYVRPVIPAEVMGKAVGRVIEGWIASGGYPRGWPVEVGQAIGEGFRQIEAEGAWLAGCGAHVYGPRQEWGLRVAIEPLMAGVPKGVVVAAGPEAEAEEEGGRDE